MRESLFSPHWYRLAERHPHLRADVTLQRQKVRDQSWYLLIDPASGRHHRINQQAYNFAGRCDGRRSVQEVWEGLLEQLRDDAPTQDEVIRMLAQLEDQGLLVYDAAPDSATLERRHGEHARRGFINPFALRIPLGDPSAWLRRLDGLAAMLFRPAGLALWIGAVLIALAAAASNWTALHAYAVRWMGTPRYLLLSLLAFPVIKGLHELGHALAVRRWGGNVLEAGFSLFVLVPAPYVDASAAVAFRARHQRVMVGAMGIMVELALAALALLVWLNVQPGLVRDLAFVTLFIASVSTLLFNGNPLLPFDGYYVLCDAIDLPNLTARSRAFWANLIRRLTRRQDATALQPARGERKWLLCYAPLSLAYRFFVSGLMILWVGAHSFVLGTLAALIMLFMLVARPVWSATGRLFDMPAGRERRRAFALAASLICTLLLILCAVPLPYHTLAAAVVWPPEQAQLRPGTDGIVLRILARDGEHVGNGQLLLKLDDPALFAARDKLESRIERLQASRFSALHGDQALVQNADQELAQASAELERVQQRIASLEVRAQMDGTLVLPHQDDIPGTLARQGELLGYVLAEATISVRAAVPEVDAVLVRDATHDAEVRMTDTGLALRAEVMRDMPAATLRLPSAALGDRGGGPALTDPDDKEGLRTVEPVVWVDLKLPATRLERIGGRAWVRFDHEAAPLAARWLRRAHQLLLAHFNPTS
jgi:putative peptide zinc metalloprotease protein